MGKIIVFIRRDFIAYFTLFRLWANEYWKMWWLSWLFRNIYKWMLQLLVYNPRKQSALYVINTYSTYKTETCNGHKCSKGNHGDQNCHLRGESKGFLFQQGLQGRRELSNKNIKHCYLFRMLTHGFYIQAPAQLLTNQNFSTALI